MPFIEDEKFGKHTLRTVDLTRIETLGPAPEAVKKYTWFVGNTSGRRDELHDESNADHGVDFYYSFEEAIDAGMAALKRRTGSAYMEVMVSYKTSVEGVGESEILKKWRKKPTGFYIEETSVGEGQDV